MPLYEYQCAKCGKKSEFIQSFSDPRETKCPHCGGALKKLLSSPSVQFKGSGFYATDYGKSGGSKGEQSEKSESGKSGEKRDSSKGEEGKSGDSGGSESKGDSKSDSAGESKGDSSKGERDSPRGKKDGGGETAAVPSSPAKRSPPVPSKKNSRDSK
jgi:putative FmdB family regulatory protein